jgi:uroporphyrinogen decarboxylase
MSERSARMSSRERVLTAFAFEEPDRVPCWLGADGGFFQRAQHQTGLKTAQFMIKIRNDFRRLFSFPVLSRPRRYPQATGMTCFGIERASIGYGQPLEHPLADATLAQVHAHDWPDSRKQQIRHSADFNLADRDQYAILGGHYSVFWHDLIDFLGMENLFMKMYDEPLLVDTILQYIVDYYIDLNRKIFEAHADKIDIFFIASDFGHNNGPFVSEQMFRRFILPHLRRLVILGHSFGLKVMLHSCGGIAPLIPALVETGLDGIQALQPGCQGMALADLKTKFGRKIVFNGGIDAQKIVLEGTPALIREKTRETLAFMKPGGGYVAGPSHDCIVSETPVENVVALFDAIREFGDY